MYPRLLEIPLGGDTVITIYSYGFMVAVAILVGSWLSGVELNRLEGEGRFSSFSHRNKPGKRGSGKQILRPSDLIGTMTILAAVFGVVGSKLFHILENFGQFLQAPGAMIFSTGGLTFYGGLICAGLAIAWYGKSKGLHVPTMFDAGAPALMLGYGIGRVGCHLAGDGDWGIAADLAAKPDFLPMWLWAETYPNNILGMTLPTGGVYPTSVYEFVACSALFGLLWVLRKHSFRAGWLFMVYLFMNGLERFSIEQIRVNRKMDLLGFDITQAELISLVLLVVGLTGTIILMRKPTTLKHVSGSTAAA